MAQARWISRCVAGLVVFLQLRRRNVPDSCAATSSLAGWRQSLDGSSVTFRLPCDPARWEDQRRRVYWELRGPVFTAPNNEKCSICEGSATSHAQRKNSATVCPILPAILLPQACEKDYYYAIHINLAVTMCRSGWPFAIIVTMFVSLSQVPRSG